MRFPALPLVALALGTVLIACTEEGPAEPTVRDVITAEALPPGWFELNLTTLDNCNGEPVDWTTRRIDRVSTKADGAGGFHFSLHRTWIGTGVGQVSGTEYVLNWPHHVNENVKPPFPYSFSRVIANNLVTKGNADNRIFRLIQKFTVNANGDVTVDRSEITLECVG
ncbi:MAG: hypothetical protein RLN75_03055 [Longimicrobiales bacterium]